MTNPMINPQPNYSGVTIQIANPAVYAGNPGYENGMYNNMTPIYRTNVPNVSYDAYMYGNKALPNTQEIVPSLPPENAVEKPAAATVNKQSELPANYAYPPQYYLNNYNYVTSPASEANGQNHGRSLTQLSESVPNSDANYNNMTATPDGVQDNVPKDYSQDGMTKEEDLSKSTNIINDLNEREAKIQAEKNSAKQGNVVPLTDEYIKSLENYLNNPNDEIRLMASKEILTRLDEDKDRYNDAALNALLNKMLQDPSKLIRISALSAFSAQLASGNEYTVKLLQNIQANPNADKEDVLQAADILLKMSAGTDVRNIPNPDVKEDTTRSKQ